MSNYRELVEKQRTFWRNGGTLSLESRKATLQKLKQLFSENREVFAEAAYKDIRRNKQTNMELTIVPMAIDQTLAKIDEWAAPTFVHPPELDALTETAVIVKEPFGVVLIIGPWNGPIFTTILPAAHAIAAGNTVIIKPSEIAAEFSAVIAKIAPKYFDESVFAVVEGGVAETTELLKERFDHILYTGCPPVAKIIMAAASKYLTPVTLELGGKSPVLIDSEADLVDAATKIVQGKLAICGQVCIGPDYILTTEDVKPKLIQELQKAIDAQGNLKEGHAVYERIISDRHFERLSNLNAKTKGKLVATSGGQPDAKDRFLPLNIYDVQADDILLEDEIFGPIIPILTVKNFCAALEYIKTHEKPLAAYLFTTNATKATRFVKETSSGGVTINDVMKHMASGLPFGGVGNSGMGRLTGKYGFDTFTHEKAVVARSGIGKQLAL